MTAICIEITGTDHDIETRTNAYSKRTFIDIIARNTVVTLDLDVARDIAAAVAKIAAPVVEATP
jgi:hypothetical protein